MTTRFRRPMLVLGTTLLIMQAVFMPVGMVYAETMTDTDEQEQVELPPMKNYLEDEQVSEPRFFFTRSRMQGTAEEPLQVTFFSDQEVSEARVFLPEEATLLKDQLQTGVSVEQGEQPHEWIVQSKRAQNTFVLPLIVEKAGNYELSAEETKAQLEISEKEEPSEEVPVEKTESSDDGLAGQEEATEEVRIEEEQENEQPVEEVREPVSEAPQEQQTNEEESDKASQVVEPTVFDGETAEVATMAQFREAVANPAIGIISVQANLTEATANVLRVDRPLLIQGNGYTLTFGINGLYFQLEEATDSSVFRIENATLTKVGVTPLINATVESSKNWTVELEDITEVNANTMRLASLPEGSIHFTGGVSNFTRTTSAQTFIEAKEVLATNQAEITISRGDAIVFFSSATVANPKFTIEQGATMTIRVVGDRGFALSFLGANSKVTITEESSFISTSTVSLRGPNPKLEVLNESTFQVITTNNVLGVRIIGVGPMISISNSSYTTSTESGRSTDIQGESPVFTVTNAIANINNSSRAHTLNITGTNPRITVIDSDLTVNSTDAYRIYLTGDEPIISLKNSKLESISNVGAYGITLNGRTPKLLMDNSTLKTDNNVNLVTVPSANQYAICLFGDDALISLDNNSILEAYADPNNLSVIYIGAYNGANRPTLRVTNGSALYATTTRSDSASNSREANVIYLEGTTPNVEISGRSKVEIKAGTRHSGLATTGNDASFTVSGNSSFSFTSASGLTRTGLDLSGQNSTFTVTGDGSVAQINSPNSVNIGNRGVINVVDDGSIQVIGRTSNATIGVITSGILHVNFDNPSSIDIRNNRSGGGNIFNVSNGSTLNSKNTDLILWQNGTNLDGDPQRSWTNLDYQLAGSNFSTIAGTNSPDRFNTSVSSFGSIGLPAYSRMTSRGRETVPDQPPVDPLDPEIDVDPENKPELPEDQGLLSIDFVSSFNFGAQAISAHDQTYYAQPQRLLNEDGTVNEDEERPNYVQVSDRRSESERNGWQLAVTQKEQFQTETKTELAGAQLQLMNQQLVTAQGGKEPSFQATNPLKLVPGNKRTLVRAEGNEGTGTWIYRFGNADAARESVALHVPKGATPEATKYSTTLVWELSAVPGN